MPPFVQDIPRRSLQKMLCWSAHRYYLDVKHQEWGHPGNENYRIKEIIKAQWKDPAVRARYTKECLEFKQQIIDKYPELYMLPAEVQPRTLCFITEAGELGTITVTDTDLADFLMVYSDHALAKWLLRPLPAEDDKMYSSLEAYFKNFIYRQCPTKQTINETKETIRLRATDEEFIIPKGGFLLLPDENKEILY